MEVSYIGVGTFDSNTFQIFIAATLECASQITEIAVVDFGWNE